MRRGEHAKRVLGYKELRIIVARKREHQPEAEKRSALMGA
jgi:hypothetical protein